MLRLCHIIKGYRFDIGQITDVYVKKRAIDVILSNYAEQATLHIRYKPGGFIFMPMPVLSPFSLGLGATAGFIPKSKIYPNGELFRFTMADDECYKHEARICEKKLILDKYHELMLNHLNDHIVRNELERHCMANLNKADLYIGQCDDYGAKYDKEN